MTSTNCATVDVGILDAATQGVHPAGLGKATADEDTGFFINICSREPSLVQHKLRVNTDLSPYRLHLT